MSLLFPDKEVDSAYLIDYEELYRNGVRGIIFDIDNTLCAHGAPADAKAIRLFQRIHSIGLATCLISNNSVERVEPFANAVQSHYIADAGKPLSAGYIKAMQLMRTDEAATVAIGDQIFTDTLGANIAGIESILVRPEHEDTDRFVRFKRIFEKLVLYFYHKHNDL